MRFANPLVLASAFVLLFITQPAVASEDFNDPVRIINSAYTIVVRYKLKDAKAGNSGLTLTVSMKPRPGSSIPESERLTLNEISAKEETSIKVQLEEKVEPNNEYRYKVSLPPELEPRIYRLTLDFRDFQGKSIERTVNLYVGNTKKGKLRFIEAESGPLLLGGKRAYSLKLVNDFADYPINISQIKVGSLPVDLIKSVEVVKDENVDQTNPQVSGNVISYDDPPLTIPPDEQRTIEVVVNLWRMPSVESFFRGFGEDSKLNFEISYNDSYERKFNYTAEKKVKVRPGGEVLFGALVIGLFIGTGTKFGLEQRGDKKSLVKIWTFVWITLLVGSITALIALAGQIQIIALERINISYDQPLTIFILGFVAAFSGVNLLKNWIEKYTSKGS